jgi:DNA-binding transcriptional MocR family regulator
MPDFQNPMGTCLGLGERMALLDRAVARGLPLVEDSAYEKLRYDGDAQPSLLALDATRSGGIDHARVVYTSTFSKLIVPSLRLGWIAGPAEIVHRLMLLKQACDLHTSTFNQMLMLDLAEHVGGSQEEIVRGLYRRRRDLTLAALSVHMPAEVAWTRPEGGMYLWVTLPAGIDGADFARRALEEEKVAVVAGKSFYAFDPVLNTIRLAFPQTPDERIDEGVARLADLLRRIIGN